MHITSPIPRSRIIDMAETSAVLRDIRRRAKRSKITHRNLILFRLSTCCGLRVSELCQLRLGDVQLGELRPSLRLPGAITKADSRGRRHGRTVPLWWDEGTLAEITAWVALRRSEGASDADLLLITRHGRRLHRSAACRSFQRSCRVLGRHVTIHDGRHTFVSTMLHIGRRLAEVCEAAGHASIATTAKYCHLLESSDCTVSRVWD